MPAIRPDHVSCRILSEVSLTVAKGEAVAIVGPSGSGKTTLLKVVAGLVPYRGHVFFDGRPMERVPPYRRSLGYLSQDLHLFPHLTVAGNVGLPLLFHGSGGARRARIAEALHLARAEHLAARWPATLSGGERQRAAIARCLARKPDLLLLDEPCSSLDEETKTGVWEEIDTLRRTLGLTAMIVTHDMREAAALADRTIHVRDGRVSAPLPAPAEQCPA